MTRFIPILLACLLSIPAWSRQSPVKLKVACIGNSVTYGYGIPDREQNSYPAQLRQLIGSAYEVANCGMNAATLLRKGHLPYAKTQQYQDAIAYKPDIAIIHLGLNETDLRNWPNYRDEFAADYYHLIDTLRAVNPAVRILISRLMAIFSGHPHFKSGTRDWYWQIQTLIPVIAKNRNVELVDLHSPLYTRPDLFPDELHPTAEGANIIATTIAGQLTGRYGGLRLAPVFADHMVLQQKMPVPVQDTANAGEEVTVRMGSESIKAQANTQEYWKAILPPIKAGRLYELDVSAVEKSICALRLGTLDQC